MEDKEAQLVPKLLTTAWTVVAQLKKVAEGTSIHFCDRENSCDSLVNTVAAFYLRPNNHAGIEVLD